MVALFLGVFIEFARFSSQMGGLVEAKSGLSAYIIANPSVKTTINRLLVDNSQKIGFANNIPKLFLGISQLPPEIKLSEGSADLAPVGNVVLGSTEASMMQEEGLINGVGSEIPNFFGLSRMKVVGILAPTGTLLDEFHLFSQASFAGLTQAKSDILVAESPLADLELYYLYDSTNVPQAISSSLNPSKTTYVLNGVTYLSTAFGYDEARLMMAEKEFQRLYDTIKDEYGSNLIVTGLPKKTLTSLDMMHFVPKVFRDNYLKSLSN